MTWQSTPWAEPLLAVTVVSGSLAVFGLLYVTLYAGTGALPRTRP